ncbi:MAG: metallophosphoesterase [Alphaproteobacteria bacterium]|nr:metallophosphoesterase [Alphaproteobacteria bacterium]
MRMRPAANPSAVLTLMLLACAAPEPPPLSAPEPVVEAPTAAPAPPPPAPAPVAEPARVVALGDLHADLGQALAALRLLEVVDAEGRWSGGETVLVQTGDQTDRGPDSKEVLELLMRLQGEAAAAGGEVVVTLGNHEVMNMMGDLRYVNPEDVADFGSAEARAQAFSAEGELGRWLRERPMVAQVGRSVFVHGGVTPEYARMGVKRMNGLVTGVLGGTLPPTVLGDSSPIWYRGYIQGDEVQECTKLSEALESLGALRMVVGHTTQRSGEILSRCGGRILGIDTGLSAHYGGHLAGLELEAGDAWAIYPSGKKDLPDP